MKTTHLLITCLLVLSLSACTTDMQTEKSSKQGFSIIKDVPLPKSAHMDLNKSMVMGSGDTWTGRLVYNIKKSPVEVIDFINNQMQEAGWSKLSELRGKETVITFMREKRVAAVKVIKSSRYYLFGETVVSIDMNKSTLSNAVVATVKEND